MPTQPLALSDDEMTIIRDLAAPIPLAERPAFLQAVADALVARPAIGVGEIHRVGRAIQSSFVADLRHETTVAARPRPGGRRAAAEA
jgi:hypothetical protein